LATQTFTRLELSRYDGKNGAPAYVACSGRVYDVSHSYHWRTGRHWAQHRAGTDLTASLESAPHGIDLLDRVPVVGLLIDE
jgi:predicted heme/steroid binding protein